MIESSLIKIFLSSMLPITELRGALPLSLLHYKIDLVQAYFLTVIGNMVPVILISYLLNPVQKFLSEHSRLFKWFFNKLFSRTRTKHSKRFETMEEIALVTFVAIPLPMTGGWSGALAAFVFGIPPKKAIPLIFLGILIAGIIVAALTLGVGFLLLK